jgi:hypothetical protein
MNQQRIAKLWERAISAEQRGDLSESKRLYRKVAVAAPTHATTFQRLGLIALVDPIEAIAKSESRDAGA